MKRAILILLISMVLSSKLYSSDPKTSQYVSAGQSAASGGVTLTAAIVYWGACGVSGIACIKASLASLSSLTSFTMAGLSLAQAQDMDRNTTTFLPSQTPLPLPQPEETPTPTLSIEDLKKTISEKKSVATQLLDQLKTKGYDAEKIIANPEAFDLSKEQLKKMQSEVAQTSHPEASSEEAMKTILGESSSVETSDTPRDIASVDASVSDTENFNFATLFSGLMPKDALENSAPGYYGNVSLKVLNPGSKMSLFERVSSKMKKVM